MRDLLLVALLMAPVILGAPVIYGVIRVSERVDHIAREARRR